MQKEDAERQLDGDGGDDGYGDEEAANESHADMKASWLMQRRSERQGWLRFTSPQRALRAAWRRGSTRKSTFFCRGWTLLFRCSSFFVGDPDGDGELAGYGAEPGEPGDGNEELQGGDGRGP